VVEVFLLKNIENDWLGFLPLFRRFSQDTSCVLVHGVSSCVLGCCHKIVYGLSKMIKWNELHA
jgi:hypothetical protein